MGKTLLQHCWWTSANRYNLLEANLVATLKTQNAHMLGSTALLKESTLRPLVIKLWNNVRLGATQLFIKVKNLQIQMSAIEEWIQKQWASHTNRILKIKLAVVTIGLCILTGSTLVHFILMPSKNNIHETEDQHYYQFSLFLLYISVLHFVQQACPTFVVL